MKKLINLGKSLSKAEQKIIVGGYGGAGDSCNAYCGSGSGVTCNQVCLNCVDAGNAVNPRVTGGDKICVQ